MNCVGDLARVNLTGIQRRQVLAIQDELHKSVWNLLGKMYEELIALRNTMWPSEQHDRPAILVSDKRMTGLRKQILEDSLGAADKVDDVLTQRQRTQLRRSANEALMGAASTEH